MANPYPGFHLSRLDFPLEELAALPSYQLALVAFHPLSTQEHRERAELLWGRARERDRTAGKEVGDNEARATKAEQALQREEQGEEQGALQGVKDEDTAVERFEKRIGQAEFSIAETDAPANQHLGRMAQTVSAIGSGDAPVCENSPILVVESAPTRSSEPAPSASAQAVAPPPPPGQPPPPTTSSSHQLPTIPIFPRDVAHDQPLPNPSFPVPPKLLKRLSFVHIVIPHRQISATLLRHFLLRPSDSAYGPMPIVLHEEKLKARSWIRKGGTGERPASFLVGYRTTGEAQLAVQRNDRVSLPLADHLWTEDRILSATLEPNPPLTLSWSKVWPPAQRDWLALGEVTRYVGAAPPATENGVTEAYERELEHVRALGEAAARMLHKERKLEMQKAALKAARQAKKAKKDRKAANSAERMAAKGGKKFKTARKQRAPKVKSSVVPPSDPQPHDLPPHQIPAPFLPPPPPSPPLILRPVDYFYTRPSAASWNQPPQPDYHYQQPPQSFSNNNQGYDQQLFFNNRPTHRY